MKLRVEIDFPDDVQLGAIDAYCAGVKRIAEAMFGLPVKFEKGESDESIRRNDAGGNSVSRDYRSGVRILSGNSGSDLREERGVDRVRSAAAGGRRTGGARKGPGLAARLGGGDLGWAGVLRPPESGSDRLSGLPEGTTEEVGVKAGHRGRRRRLWDQLKKVGVPGRRFRR